MTPPARWHTNYSQCTLDPGVCRMWHTATPVPPENLWVWPDGTQWVTFDGEVIVCPGGGPQEGRNGNESKEKEAESTYDPAPAHYDGNGMEPWEVVDAFGLGFYDGNVLKYLLRAGKKDIAPRLDDLKKARNYLNKLIELEENRW